METVGKHNDKYDFMVKVIIIGDSGVGKTNIITRFCQNQFKESYVATIGVDFKIKSISIADKRYRMQIWDTAGQERFKNITQTYYKGAGGILLAYSVTDRTSFQNIERWVTQIEANAPKNVVKILVATKLDLDSERTVSQEEGKALARRHNINFMEVSAKAGVNVKEVFEKLVECINTKYEADGQLEGVSSKREPKTQLNKKDDDKKKCAC